MNRTSNVGGRSLPSEAKVSVVGSIAGNARVVIQAAIMALVLHLPMAASKPMHENR